MIPVPERCSPAQWLRQWVADEAGESLLEIAISLSVLLAFTFGIMQIGMAYYNKERISECAREGARYAALHGSTCINSMGSCAATQTDIQNFVKGLGYPNLGGGTLQCVASWPDGDNNPKHHVTVTVTYTFPYKIPFVRTSALTFSSSSTMLYLM